MDYETAYKEALGWMRSIYPTLRGADKEDAEHYFPELAESEDERIRRVMIEHFKSKTKGTWCNMPIKDIITFLEKQKERKPVTIVRIPKFRVGDIIQHVPLEKWDSSKKITSIDEHGYNFNLSHLGDTVSGGAIGFAFEDEYELVEQKPVHTAKEMWKEMRFEVYAQASGNIHEPNYADDSTKMFSLCDIDEIFENIADSVVEQKPAEWSEEDERTLNCIINVLDILGFEEYCRSSRDQDVEEERLYYNEIQFLKKLKSLRPIQKQEWSEEDLQHKSWILECLADWERKMPEYAEDFRAAYKWLKSLRPQPHWKPSEEQMKALNEVANNGVLLDLFNDLLKLL